MRIYGPLAAELVARCPVDLGGRTVLDLGAGTGAASVAADGARVVAVDLALGMLRQGRRSRPPGAVGDAVALPFRSSAFDVVLAAFSLNHLVDPPHGVREVGRVAREYVMASVFAATDDHPVKHAVDVALAEAGWVRPPGLPEPAAMGRWWGSPAATTATIERGGLVAERVDRVDVAFPDLGPSDLVRWRLGMASCAAFLATRDQAPITARALDLLGDCEALVRSVVFIAARAR
jgi:SAM-dependent methyltransferase